MTSNNESLMMGFLLSEAWRQPEDESEGMQDPADVLEKIENQLNENYEELTS